MKTKINKNNSTGDNMKKVTKDTKLGELLEREDAKKVLEKHNTPCLTCPMAAYEQGTLTIGKIAKNYGLDLEAMLAEINKNKKEKK